ncbi:MAG: endo-1,4-beta-xylanase [Planctomycetia bacterium]|nr:endo-1,4-beta-xylanase [Planctomycetia bacterium]
MRFLVTPPNRITAAQAERAYLVGPEQIPWVTRVQFDGGVLSVSRNESDSASLCLPIAIEGRGETTLTTGTLVERFQPYHLTVELARGKINQLRGQLSEWQTQGLPPKEQHEGALHDALRQLASAATSQHDPSAAAGHADNALRMALEIADSVAARYVEKIMTLRHRQSEHLPTLLGGNLGRKLLDANLSRQFLQAFNAAVVPVVWRDVESQEGNYRWNIFDRQVEWCHTHGLKVIAGPLLQLDDRGLPDWLAIWQGDFDNILSFISDYVETVVHRYRGKINVWQCAAKVNTGKVLALADEEKLRLAVRAFEITRQADPETPAIMRFDQPWAEYMGRADSDLSPLHFADVLVRSGLELAGLGLDLNVGYWPGGTYLRDSLEYNRFLDRWASLGLPLWLFLTAPSGEEPDSRAYGQSRPTPGAYPEGWTPVAQRQLVRDVAPMLLAKPAVQALVYNHLCDAHRHEFPHSGLFDREGTAKPALATLAKLRKQHLG